LRDHFAGKPSAVRKLFEQVRAAVESCGPVTVLSEKTRIAFHVRMSFMAIVVRRSGLRGHFVFATVHEHPRLPRVDTISPRNHVHHFRLAGPGDVDAAFIAWVREAYSVGRQDHLSNPGDGRRPSRP
jgi:predicted transport protein